MVESVEHLTANVCMEAESNSSTMDVATTKKSAREEEHHEWDRPIEFVLSLISNSVGVGNVWRFPYLAARSGGGAFLIPYFILYFLIGAPLYYLELAVGQFSSRGPDTAFMFAKGWQGLGYAMIVNSVLTMLFYNVVIAWALFYFVASFRSRLLWSDCGHWWNSAQCFVPGRNRATTYTHNETIANCSTAQLQNINTIGRVTATEEFFYKLLLNKSSGFDQFGVPELYLSLSLLVAWIAVGLCIIHGVKSSGKVAYFTALFPYIVLLILIIYSATLDGAKDGVRFYIFPNWALVRNFRTWQTAASQVFFSLGIGFGSLMAYSSSNKFKNNFFRQMCIVVSCDCFTGVFAGFAVFATVGFLAKSLNEPVATYAQSSGPGLAFVTYPEAISKMPASPFFAIIFFLMLLTLGLGSQFALTDVPITSILEIFPRMKSHRPVVVGFTCIVSFLISLPFTCPGGIYLLELFQEYAANVSLLVIGFFEVTTVAYIYGFNRFMEDIKLMLNKRAAEYYLFLTWGVTVPILVLIIGISKLISSAPITLGAGAGFPEYTFPQWSTIVGWCIFVLCVIPIPFVFLINYIREYRIISRSRQAKLGNNVNFEEKPCYLEALTRNNSPSFAWGPRRQQDQTGRYAHLRMLSDNSTTSSAPQNQSLPI